MDDEDRRKERLQQFILELNSLSEEARSKFLQECALEAKNFRNDGWSVQFYKDMLEAAKNV